MRDHDTIDAQDLVARYVAGTLDEAEEERFEAHLLECPRCLERVGWEEDLRGAFQAAGELDPALASDGDADRDADLDADRDAETETGAGTGPAPGAGRPESAAPPLPFSPRPRRWLPAAAAGLAAGLVAGLLLGLLALPAMEGPGPRQTLPEDPAGEDRAAPGDGGAPEPPAVAELEAELLAAERDAERSRAELEEARGALERERRARGRAEDRADGLERRWREPLTGLAVARLGAQRSGPGAPEARPQRVTLALPGAGEPSWLVVILEVATVDFERYSATLSRPGAGELWAGEGLAPNAEGAFHLALPTGLLDAGVHRLALRGQRPDGRSVPVTEVVFEIVPEG